MRLQVEYLLRQVAEVDCADLRDARKRIEMFHQNAEIVIVSSRDVTPTKGEADEQV